MDSTFFWFLLASLVLLIINGRLRTDRRGIHLKMRYEGDGVGAYDVAIHSGLWITAAWLAMHSHPESALTLISLSLLVGLISLSVYLLYGPLPTEYQVLLSRLGCHVPALLHPVAGSPICDRSHAPLDLDQGGP